MELKWKNRPLGGEPPPPLNGTSQNAFALVLCMIFIDDEDDQYAHGFSVI